MKYRKDLGRTLSIFGPIAALFVALALFQYHTYTTNKQRLEDQLSKQQDVITLLAADRVSSAIREVLWNLDKLAYTLGTGRDSTKAQEEAGRLFDYLSGQVAGMAYFDASGAKVFSIYGKGAQDELPANSKYEDFFTRPKAAMMPYVSPVTRLKSGNETVVLSYPVRTGVPGGEFGGVVVAEVSRALFNDISARMARISRAEIVFYDQNGKRIYLRGEPRAAGEESIADIIAGITSREIAARYKAAAEGNGRARSVYYPIEIEGYRWYISSSISLSRVDRLMRGDVLFLSLTGLFFLVALFAGGVYFSRVYRAKVAAEAEASYNLSLAAKSEALEAEKDKLRAVLDSIPDGVMLLDKDGAVLDANTRVTEILMPEGLPVPEGAGEESEDHLKAFLGPVKDGELREIKGRYYKIIKAPFSGGGKAVGEVRLVRDVTVERMLEERKADLVSMITHDIKNPLSVIMGTSEWLGDPSMSAGMSEEAKAGLEGIRRAASRVMAIMEDFLFLTSIEGMNRMKKSRVKVDLFLNKAILEFYSDAKQKGITLKYDLPQNLPEVPMDETQMMRAVSNLLSNALKYTPEGGEVSVNAKNFRDYIAISVSDNGEGIGKEDLPNIFKRYYRAKRAKSGKKGSGLGLAVVKAVVESHGGTVDVVSEEGVGSTFTIRLPHSDTAEGPKMEAEGQGAVAPAVSE